MEPPQSLGVVYHPSFLLFCAPDTILHQFFFRIHTVVCNVITQALYFNAAKRLLLLVNKREESLLCFVQRFGLRRAGDIVCSCCALATNVVSSDSENSHNASAGSTETRNRMV